MLRMLKSVCDLLKVLTLMKVAIAFSSEDLADPEALGNKTFELNEHYHQLSPRIELIGEYPLENEVEGIPSEPTFPRAFVEFDNRLYEKDVFVTFRWKQPALTNGIIQKYTVVYWFIENKSEKSMTIKNIPATTLQCKEYNVKPDTMYFFIVQAHNEVGAGPYTNPINVSTTHENPVPLLLVTSRNDVKVLDIDLQTGLVLNDEFRATEIAYSALESKIYWINDIGELMTWDIHQSIYETKRNYTKITDLHPSAHNLCIDWVARNLYWLEYSDQTSTIHIMKLDLTLWQIGIVKCDNILKINGFTDLNVLPSIGYFYWMGLNSNNEYVIMQSDFKGKNIKPFLKNEYNICSCSHKLLKSSSMKIDNTNIDKPLMYWTSEDRLIAADIYGCRCKLILSAGNNEIFFNFLTIDKTNIYWYSNSERLIYILNKKYALLEYKGNLIKFVQKVNVWNQYHIHQVIALGKSLQPYPPTMCLIPHIEGYYVEKVTITANSIVVSLPEPVPIGGCEKYNLATTIYIISVSHCLNNDRNEEFDVQTHERHYEIQNLTPFTEYTLKLALSNFYIDKLSNSLLFGASVILRTTPGKLNAPEDVTVQVLTPTLAAVYWMPPKKLNCVAVNYEVHWISILFPNSTQKITYQMPRNNQLINQPDTVDSKFFMAIQHLLPGQEYLVYVRVYPANFSNFFNDSLSKSVYMYSEPNQLILSGVSTNSMNISWIPSVNLTIHYILEYKNDAMPKWHIADNFEINNDKIIYYIKNLLPRTLYKFRLNLRYPEYTENFTWPPDERFIFKTLGDVPSAPGRPTVTRLPNFMYQLNWESVQAHHSQVTLYRLEGLVVKNNYKDDNQTDKNEKHWNLYYNGTKNYWIITRDMDQKYRFRVQAENAYGFGEWSESSAVVDLTESIEILATKYYLPLILSLVITLVIYVCYFYYSYRQQKKSKEQVLPPIMADIKLATLYQIPSENVQQNTLYAPRLQYNPYEFALTIIRKEQITRATLLGSGAFGKVYQGTVKNFEGSGTTPVAIKMLRENASSQEITKFKQEAEIMSHFRHNNVLRLLGICMDVNSPWLILELMEAGDLLKYLRDSRTSKPSDSHALRLQDLLAMCEDVARGCCYLEELHFVHRDLACRNCLISARDRENRIVKIGDFGLARDIYKDDYYRMKGEGLLPVRWMAPESLMIGIFTSKSDVWAFGVLMWEITSLGEQPYPAKSHSEVLQYVRDGGKLPKPLNCPPTLYQLMQHCWNAADDRPNFILCLENIVTMRDNIEDAILSSVDIMRRTELPPSGQIEDLVESIANRTSGCSTTNDASNDVIEPLTYSLTEQVLRTSVEAYNCPGEGDREEEGEAGLKIDIL